MLIEQLMIPFFEGCLVTLRVFFITLVCSLPLAVVLASIQAANIKLLNLFFKVFISLFISVTILAIIVLCFNIKIFEHNSYDSYTRQALAWREGRTYLNNDPSEIAYLELAIFDGRYYDARPQKAGHRGAQARGDSTGRL